jgi:hypothetical protein
VGKLSSHAEFKIELLNKHGFIVSKDMVLDTVIKPDKIVSGQKGRLIAQKKISERHVLRVIYEKHNDDIEIITIYPGLRRRYEN